ncbi:phage major capsid protein [Dietzia papillomatosis]|uniref:phage major capsid protein n=1 Tax=Dietzia papillomatosis TaxID=282305 RepID=UPI000781FA23|nr:phage major capsid protein [Dietzia papillomatosis]
MATETTNTSSKAWSPDVTAFAASEVIGDALVLQASTVAGRIEGDEPVLRVAYVDDDAAEFVAEGVEIPEADPVLSEVTVATGKVAQLVRVSAEQYAQNGAAAMLSESVRRAVIKRADTAFLNQAAPLAPAMTPAAGLLNIEDIIDGGAVAADLDGLIDLAAQIGANGGTPSHIILSPTAWASLRKFKTGTGSAQNLLGAGTTDATMSLLGLPVLVTPAMTGDNGLILDRSAVVSAVGDVKVATSSEAYFSSDSVGVRATFRFGQNVVHPDRVGVFTVTAPAA